MAHAWKSAVAHHMAWSSRGTFKLQGAPNNVPQGATDQHVGCTHVPGSSHATHNVRFQNGECIHFVGLPASASSHLPAMHLRVPLKQSTFKTAILVRHRPCGQWQGDRTYSYASWKFPSTGRFTKAWHQRTWKREEVSAYVRSIGFTGVSIWNASEGIVLCEIATASARVPHECNKTVSVQEKNYRKAKRVVVGHEGFEGAAPTPLGIFLSPFDICSKSAGLK